MLKTDTFTQFKELAEEKTPLFAGVWSAGLQMHGRPWAVDLQEHVERVFGGNKASWEKGLLGYAQFAMDAIQSQRYFVEHGKYQNSALSDVHVDILDNKNYMLDVYLPGLYLSHFLWPHHYKLLQYFRENVMSHVSHAKLFYDVGMGTGLYSLLAKQRFLDSRGIGFDLSDHSIAFTKKILKAFDLDSGYQCYKGNVLTMDLPEEKCDFLISQEVLEHLEDPKTFCQRLFELIKPGGTAYITAAINAAHNDHIYLFRSADEVQSMLREAGWHIQESKTEYAYAPRGNEPIPCVAGFICKKNGDC